jgi:hypothetical protein
MAVLAIWRQTVCIATPTRIGTISMTASAMRNGAGICVCNMWASAIPAVQMGVQGQPRSTAQRTGSAFIPISTTRAAAYAMTTILGSTVLDISGRATIAVLHALVHPPTIVPTSHQTHIGSPQIIPGALVCRTGSGITVRASMGSVTLSVPMAALDHMTTSASPVCLTANGRSLVRNASAIRTGGYQTAPASVGHATQLAELQAPYGTQQIQTPAATQTAMVNLQWTARSVDRMRAGTMTGVVSAKRSGMEHLTAQSTPGCATGNVRSVSAQSQATALPVRFTPVQLPEPVSAKLVGVTVTVRLTWATVSQLATAAMDQLQRTAMSVSNLPRETPLVSVSA